MYLIMLNLLIASVGSTFGKIRETQAQFALRERANLINDCRSFPLSQFFSEKREPETYLFIVKQDLTVEETNWNKKNFKLYIHN